jgi:hypothetical protein
MYPRSFLGGSALLLVAMGCRNDAESPTAPVGLGPSGTELAAAALSWTERAPMPTGRSGLVGAVVYDAQNQPTFYAIGGGGVQGPLLPTVEAYNFGTDTWTTKSPLPEGLTEANGAGVIDGRIYVPGGINTNDVNGDYLRRTLYVYDPVSDSWSRKADLPIVTMGGVSGVIGRKLYVLAGDPGARQFFRYDPATDKWESLASSPVDHFRGAAAVVQGKFYAAGGEKFANDGPYAIKKLHVYDPATDTWSAKALMPRGVFLAAGARLNGRLYVIGGLGASGVQRVVQEYNPATDTWTLKPPLPYQLCCSAASNFVLSGRRGIILVGGQGRPEQSSTYVYSR